MSSLIKSATIQVRVSPLVKAASEQILWGIGLSMSDAVELFLRRIIVDTRIPFDIVALDSNQLEQALTDVSNLPGTHEVGEPAKEKIENLFRRSRTSGQIQARKRKKTGAN
jgi:addiction module RelB/DinJ family antitoxin